VVEKIKQCFFGSKNLILSHFNLKTSSNTFRIPTNQFLNPKKPKKRFKNPKSNRVRFIFLDLIFFRKYWGSKTPSSNLSRSIEPVDTKKNHFYDQIWLEQTLSLITEIRQPLSFSNQRLENNTNKFLYQKWIFEI